MLSAEWLVAFLRHRVKRRAARWVLVAGGGGDDRLQAGIEGVDEGDVSGVAPARAGAVEGVAEADPGDGVAEAEVGYDVDELRARWGRAPRGAAAAQVVPVRLTAEELAAVMSRAEREGLNRSEAIRAALAAWSHVA